MKINIISKRVLSLFCVCAVLLIALPVAGQNSVKLNFEQFADWQSEWGTLNNGIITWAEGRNNYAKGLIPTGSHNSSPSFNVKGLSFNSSNGSAQGLTDENLNSGSKAWFQFNAAGNPDKEPTTYPWRFTFDLGSSKAIDEILIITHATNKQVMLNSFEIYLSDELTSLYSVPSAAVENVGKNAKGYYSLKPETDTKARYVGLSITDFNYLTNSDIHNAGVLLLRELAILGPESAAQASDSDSYYSTWQSSWGTLNDNKITWNSGKLNLLHGIMPALTKAPTSLNSDVAYTANEGRDLAGLTDENLSPSGITQLFIDKKENKQPDYPVYLVFDMGSVCSIDEILLSTIIRPAGNTTSNFMLCDYDIYIAESFEELNNQKALVTTRKAQDDNGFHYYKLPESRNARYVVIKVCDPNPLRDGQWGAGLLAINEFAVFGKGSPIVTKVTSTFSNTLPQELGAVKNDKISWNSSKLDLIRRALPVFTKDPKSQISDVVYELNEKRDLSGLTDGSLASDGVTQVFIDKERSKQPDYPVYLIFDMGSVCSFDEILLSTFIRPEGNKTNNFMLCNYDIYIAESFEELNNQKALVTTRKAQDDNGFHYYKLPESRNARYVMIKVCDPNPLRDGQWGAGLLAINEFAVLGAKSDKHELVRIETVKSPDRTSYMPGEELDLSGISLFGYYADGNDRAIALKDCKVSGYDKDTIGEQTVTITYGKCSVSFKVTVSVTGVICEDAKVTDAYLKSLGTNHLSGKKMQVASTERSYMKSSSEDGIGIWQADNLTDGSVSTDSKDLVRIKFNSAKEMPCTIVYDMAQSISVNQIAVVGTVSGENDFQIPSYRVYLSDTREGLTDEKNLILSYDNTGNWVKNDGIKGSAQVFGFTGKPKGRFIAFVLDNNQPASAWGASRKILRELGVYGEKDLGKPTNLLANTIVKGNDQIQVKANREILWDNDYDCDSSSKVVNLNKGNGSTVTLLYDLGAGKELTGFRLAGGSDDPNKLIPEFKIYAAQTEDKLLAEESLVYHYVRNRSADATERVVSYDLKAKKSYQYVAFVIEPAADGSCLLSEVAAIGLSWQLNRIENLLYLSNTSFLKAYTENKTNYSLTVANTFAHRDNPGRVDMSSYVFDGNAHDINVSLYGAKRGEETNNLLIDLEYSSLLNQVEIYGIGHESLYNAKKVSIYISDTEDKVWGAAAKPIATYTDASRSGTMKIAFSETVGRYIRICIDEGADASVCHGSDLAVISEICANGMSFNSTNSVTTVPSFKDKATGISLDVLPLNYRDYYDTAVKMRVTAVKADEALACSLKDYGLRLCDDRYFKIELLDKNGKVLSDLGGRKVLINVPITDKQKENLIYLAEVEYNSLSLLESAIEENKFAYTAEKDSGTIEIGLVMGYNYPDDPLYYDDPFTDNDDIPSDNSSLSEEPEDKPNQDGENKKPPKKVLRKKTVRVSNNLPVILIIVISGVSVLAIGTVITVIIIKKRRKCRKEITND